MPVLLAYPNRTDAATLSGGSWQSALPLTNLQTRKISQVARSTDATNASTQFEVILDKSRLIQAMGLINHNLSSLATYQIQVSNDNFATVAYDSGVQLVWPIVYPFGILEWEQDNWWSGTYNDEDKVGYNLTFINLMTMGTLCQQIRFFFFDTSNPAGYIQIGRLFLAPAYTPTINMSMGASLGYETNTVVDPTLSGAEYFDKRTPYRVAKFSLKWMTEDEGMSFAFDMQRLLGIDQEVLFMWDINDTAHKLRRSFMGRIRTLSQIEMPYVNVLSTPFEIKELL